MQLRFQPHYHFLLQGSAFCTRASGPWLGRHYMCAAGAYLLQHCALVDVTHNAFVHSNVVRGGTDTHFNLSLVRGLALNPNPAIWGCIFPASNIGAPTSVSYVNTRAAQIL